MARRGTGVTRKHLARAERERRQRRLILGGSITVVVLLILVLAYGIYDTVFVQPYQEVVEVNGDVITSSEFEGRVRLIQREYLNQLTQYMQMEQFFGTDPAVLQELRNAEVQLQTQLANPALLGRDVLESLILQRILIAEAEQQGIRVSEEELQAEVQRNFNFYPGGTPTRAPTFTPLPTSTLDPTAAAAITATVTALPEPSPTTGPTRTAIPTATPYTLEAYQQNYADFIDSLSDFRISEDDFLSYIEIGLLQDKMRENFEADIEREQEQVFVRVILAESEEAADQVVARLEEGESWDDLALEFSQDPLTRDLGGEIGWNTLADLLGRYNQPGVAVFAGGVGEVIGPLPAEPDGYYVFQVDERETRPISDEAYQRAQDQAFSDWLTGLRDQAEVTIAEDWQEYLPPAVPVNLQ